MLFRSSMSLPVVCVSVCVSVCACACNQVNGELLIGWLVKGPDSVVFSPNVLVQGVYVFSPNVLVQGVYVFSPNVLVQGVYVFSTGYALHSPLEAPIFMEDEGHHPAPLSPGVLGLTVSLCFLLLLFPSPLTPLSSPFLQSLNS